jgi:hypothetical protein
VLRIGEQALRRRGLDDDTGVHHRHAVGHARDHAKIVRDQNHAHAAVARNPAQELKDLGLHGHVKRRRWLVREQEPGRARDRHRDDNALAHADGHFVGIGTQALLRCRDADLAEEADRFGSRFSEAEAAMGSQRLGDLVADSDHGMERRSRVLEDHANRRPANLAHAFLVERDEVGAVEPRAPARSRPLKKTQERHRHRRLAASALADEAERLARIEREGDAVDGVGPIERDRQILDREKRRARVRGAAHGRCIFGSSASRSPSPMKLKLVTASVIARPGITASHGSTRKSLWALVSMLPQLACGGWIP